MLQLSIIGHKAISLWLTSLRSHLGMSAKAIAGFVLQLLGSGFELNNSRGLCHRVVVQGCSVFQGYLLKLKGCSNICNGKHVTEWLEDG